MALHIIRVWNPHNGDALRLFFTNASEYHEASAELQVRGYRIETTPGCRIYRTAAEALETVGQLLPIKEGGA
jgi:hypothetical protein